MTDWDPDKPFYLPTFGFPTIPPSLISTTIPYTERSSGPERYTGNASTTTIVTQGGTPDTPATKTGGGSGTYVNRVVSRPTK